MPRHRRSLARSRPGSAAPSRAGSGLVASALALALAAAPGACHPHPAGSAPPVVSAVPPPGGAASPPPVDAVEQPLIDRPRAVPRQLPPLAPVPPPPGPAAPIAGVIVTPPSAAPPPRLAPDPSDRDVERLRRQLTRARPADRTELLDRLADALDRRAEGTPPGSSQRRAALQAADDLLADPGFHRYAHADRALFRHGQLLMRDGREADARKVLLLLVKDYPDSVHVPDVYVVFGDYYFDAAQLDSARRFYEKALLFPTASVGPYARYKLGWVHLNLSDGAAALEAFVQVAGSTAQPVLRRSALHDAVRAYALVGKPDKAVPFFTRLDAGQALELAAELGHTYYDQGQAEQAIVTLTAVAEREPDPDRACRLRLDTVEAALMLGDRGRILSLGDRLVDGAGGGCRADADRLFGELAWAWQAELVHSDGDPAPVRHAWDLAAAVATTHERAAAIAVNRAEAAWAAASGSASPHHWLEVADLFHAAADATGDPALDDAAIDAWSNAAATAGRGGRIDGEVAARIRAGLATVVGPAAPRAHALAARLR